jgi:LysR family nitrogen assimilation transcriptional regulator
MTVNFKTLGSFVKAVDCKSLSGAAQQLSIAQPALSQQISLLEQHFQQKLLIRSKVGVTPTDAGRELYRHAVIMLRQLETAEYEVPRTANVVRGRVSVGLATYSSVSVLAAPLLRRVREEFPHINLFINDNFGLVLSELVMSGAMDMAVIYGKPSIRTVKIQPLLKEELFLIAPPGSQVAEQEGDSLTVASLKDTELLLPGRMHRLRQLIDRAFEEAGATPNVAAEIESVATMREAIAGGLGATILPWAVANTFEGAHPPVIRRLTAPTVEATVSMCVPENRQVSEAALAVADILAQLVRELASSGQAYGIEEADAA